MNLYKLDRHCTLSVPGILEQKVFRAYIALGIFEISAIDVFKGWLSTFQCLTVIIK